MSEELRIIYTGIEGVMFNRPPLQSESALAQQLMLEVQRMSAENDFVNDELANEQIQQDAMDTVVGESNSSLYGRVVIYASGAIARPLTDYQLEQVRAIVREEVSKAIETLLNKYEPE